MARHTRKPPLSPPPTRSCAMTHRGHSLPKLLSQPRDRPRPHQAHSLGDSAEGPRPGLSGLISEHQQRDPRQ